jgi:hypothetical protein
MVEEEEKIFYCINCECEYDPFAEDVKIIREASRRSYLIKDSSGRAHSLIVTTWKKIQRRRELGNQSLSLTPSNLYGEENDTRTEQDTEGQESAVEIEHPDARFQEAAREEVA